MAAVWDKRKGLEDIVTISKNVEAKVIVVGVTEKQKLNLPEHIAAYTRTNNVEELRKLYAVSDVFVNPTYEDNFPTTDNEPRKRFLRCAYRNARFLLPAPHRKPYIRPVFPGT